MFHRNSALIWLVVIGVAAPIGPRLGPAGPGTLAGRSDGPIGVPMSVGRSFGARLTDRVPGSVEARDDARAAAGDVLCGPAAISAAPAHDSAAVRDSLQATASVIREATEAEGAWAVPLALRSEEVGAARLRLAPLSIDIAHPRLVGTTVGRIGVYFPIRGAIDGPASQYGLWFDAATRAIVAEAEFVHLADGVDTRIVLGGKTVIDETLGVGSAPGQDFWSCFRWCVGASLSNEVYVVLRTLCGKACYPWPNVWCELCMIGVSILEVGMISGCTNTCTRGG